MRQGLIWPYEVFLPNHDITYINPIFQVVAEQVSPQSAVVLPGGDRGTAQLIRILRYMTSWVILCPHSLLPFFPVVSTTQHKINVRSLVKMQWAILAAATLFAQNVAAQQMLRFACSQLVVER